MDSFRVNLLLAGALLASQVVLLVIPAIGLSGTSALLLGIPLVLLTNTYWALLHEAIHGVAHPRHWVNEAIGRALGIAFGSPLALLRAGHLLHHRFNRFVEASEAFDDARTCRTLAAIRHYTTILGGLYCAEVIAGLALLLPAPWWRRMLGAALPGSKFLDAAMTMLGRPGARAAARVDALAVIVLYGVAFSAGGGWLLAGLLAVRAFLISFFDNAYHYGTALHDRRAARNLRVSTAAAQFLLNFNLHGIHHLEPWVPWFELPGRFRARRAGYDGAYLRTTVQQLAGPIPLSRLRNLSEGTLTR